MTMEHFDDDDEELLVKNVKKQRTEERLAPLFTRQQLIDSIRVRKTCRNGQTKFISFEKELSLEKERRRTSMPLNLPSNQ